MISIDNYIELGAKILPEIFHWGGDVLGSKKKKREATVYEFLAAADILGLSAQELADKAQMRLSEAVTALHDLRRRDHACLRGGRWYVVRSSAVGVARW